MDTFEAARRAFRAHVGALGLVERMAVMTGLWMEFLYIYGMTFLVGCMLVLWVVGQR